jgi:hypothetical protein
MTLKRILSNTSLIKCNSEKYLCISREDKKKVAVKQKQSKTKQTRKQDTEDN